MEAGRRKLIPRESFRASVLHHSDTQAVENHCTAVLCLDNAFVLIERHPNSSLRRSCLPSADHLKQALHLRSQMGTVEKEQFAFGGV
jgi:hypothetical protein